METAQNLAKDLRPAHLVLSELDHFYKYGYKIFTQNNPLTYADLNAAFAKHLTQGLRAFSNNPDLPLLELGQYHEVIKSLGLDHHQFIKFIGRTIPSDVISVDHPYLKEVLAKASAYFGRPIHIFDNKIEFRVVRPGQEDNNPLHRDHWFPYFTPLVNIYVPLAGSYSDSAMKIVPRSHHWSDEEVIPTFGYAQGKTVKANGVQYSVPEIKYCAKEIKPHRPDVQLSDFMLFSPLLIHGGGDNLSDETRFSFEIRLEFDA